MLKLIVVPWAVCIIVEFLRRVQLSSYCKRKGYKSEKKPVIERLINETRNMLLCGIPILNLILIVTLLVQDDEKLLEPLFEKGSIYKVDEHGEKIPYRRFNFKI